MSSHLVPIVLRRAAAGLLLLAALGLATTPLADQAEPADTRRVLDTQVAVFTALHVGADERVRGDVVCIGCSGAVEGDVSGDIVVIGGNLALKADVGREMVAVLSQVALEEGVTIRRGFVNVMSQLDDRGAEIRGERVSITPFSALPFGEGPFGAVGSIFGWIHLVQVVVLFVVLLILVLIAPDGIRRMSAEAPARYALALLVGLLVHVAVTMVHLVLVVSVIGLPVVFVTHSLFLLLRSYGRAALFHLAGQRMVGGRRLSVLGAVLLGFLVYAILLVLPFFFGLVGLLIGLSFWTLLKVLVDWPAVGLLILTRGGRAPVSVEATARPG